MRVKALLVTAVLGLGMVFGGCGSSKQGASGSNGKQSSSSAKSGGTSSSASSSSKSGGKSSSSAKKPGGKSKSSSKKSQKSGSDSGSKSKKMKASAPKTTGTTTASGNPTGTNDAAASLFQKKCQVCHGQAGIGASAPKLDAGLNRRFATQTALQTFIKKNMPFNDPGTLSDAQAAALARYLWSMQKP